MPIGMARRGHARPDPDDPETERAPPDSFATAIGCGVLRGARPATGFAAGAGTHPPHPREQTPPGYFKVYRTTTAVCTVVRDEAAALAGRPLADLRERLRRLPSVAPPGADAPCSPNSACKARWTWMPDLQSGRRTGLPRASAPRLLAEGWPARPTPSPGWARPADADHGARRWPRSPAVGTSVASSPRRARGRRRGGVATLRA